MDYQHLTEDERNEVLAQAILDREREHFHYEVNRMNYLAIIDSLKDLPKEWPEKLKQYRLIIGEQLATVISGDTYDLVLRLQFRDRINLLHATTIGEQKKVEAVHDALSGQLPTGIKRDAALKRLTDKAATSNGK